MATNERCGGITAAGQPCRRLPTRGTSYCLAHDPARRDEHAEVARLGGVARHDPEALGLKAEVRELRTAMRGGDVSAGVGSVLLQAIRLLRELEAADKQDAANDGFIEAIQPMRNAGDVPDLSEPAANDPHEGNAGVVDMSKPNEADEPDAPRLEDYRKPDGRLDSQPYIHDRAAYHAPLESLSIAERLKRWQSGRRW